MADMANTDSRPFPYLRLMTIATMITFVLGVHGHLQMGMTDGGAIVNLWDGIFGTVQMFTLNGGLPFGDKPFSLEMARMLALLVFIYTLRGILLVTTRQFQCFFWRLRNHIIVIGASPRGWEIARHLSVRETEDEHRRILFIDEDETLLETAKINIPRALILTGSTQNHSVLQSAQVMNAERIVIVGNDEIRNLEVAEAIARYCKGKGDSCLSKTCYVEVNRLFSNVVFRQFRSFKESAEQFRFVPYNPYATAARKALLCYPLDGEGIRQEERRRPHLFISGFGRMGESLLLYAAKIGHYANFQRVKATIVDPDGEALKARFLFRYPHIQETIDLDFVNTPLEHQIAIARLDAAGEPDKELLTIAICLPQADRAFEQVLNLPHKVVDKALRILVRMDHPEPLRLFSERADSKRESGIQHLDPLKFKSFGSFFDTCDLIDDNIDEWARNIHKWYREKARYENRLTQDLDVPWEKLDIDLLDSNRQQADHVGVKLRALGIVPMEGICGNDFVFPVKFSADEIELLAKMEHNRWNADRWLSGWTPSPKGSVKDSVHKTSPYMIPYEELEPNIQEYDRAAVRIIPELMRMKP